LPDLSTAAAAPKEVHALSLSSLSKLWPLQNHSQQSRSITYAQKAKDLNQQGIDDQLSDYDTAIADEKEKRIKAPWHREGADTPPVRRQRSAGAMTKGR
jgi:calcium uniporter protein, mitochondrial